MTFPEKLKKEIKLRIGEIENYSFDKSLFIEEKLLNEILYD